MHIGICTYECVHASTDQFVAAYGCACVNLRM